MHQVGARKCSDGPLSAMHDRCKTKVSEGGENLGTSTPYDARALHDDAVAGRTGAHDSLPCLRQKVRGKDLEPNIQSTGRLSARCWANVDFMT
jgi:hypothetical protein